MDINWDLELILIYLPTQTLRWVSFYSTGTIGRVSNINHYNTKPGKAGFNRNRNVRPTVRGVAMNPVDHPHGGRTKTNSPEVTPWGKIAKFNR